MIIVDCKLLKILKWSLLVVDCKLLKILKMLISVKEYGLKTLALSGIAVSGIVLAYSIKHYLKRQRYSHIKGPKTKGYLHY